MSKKLTDNISICSKNNHSVYYDFMKYTIQYNIVFDNECIDT